MVVAISGAVIVSEYEGPYTNMVTYKQRCDNCGYVSPKPPISIRTLPYETVAHGIYHKGNFVCAFCRNRQMVEIQG